MIRRAPMPHLMAVLAFAAFTLACVASAQAGQWDRFYVGAFAGAALGQGEFVTDVGVVSPQAYFSSNQNIASIEGNASGKDRSRSFAGGVQIGGNRQFDRLVVGAELDFGAFRLAAGRGAADIEYPTFPGLAYAVDTDVSTNWLLTARGRLGWLASPNLLVYFTGGLAASDVKVSNSFEDYVLALGVRVANGASSRSRTRFGYTLGGGFEFALDGPWSLKAEYLYVDLGEVATNAVVVPPVSPTRSPLDTSASLTASIARVGLNYGF